MENNDQEINILNKQINDDKDKTELRRGYQSA